jgi:hypothetical protein
MTTIAWCGDMVASDTAESEGWFRSAVRSRKIVQAGGVLAGASGSGPIGDRFLDLVLGGALGLPDMGVADKDGYGATGVIGLPGGVFVRYYPGLPPSLLRAPYYAIGSGAAYAMGAMASGADAVSAVLAALRHDIGSGGTVHHLARRRRA